MTIELAVSLGAVARPYAVLLVDVWGVVHNGVQPFEGASAALRAARARGQAVILISNAPRLASDIPPQFARLGVPTDIYDAIVTSGDATREIVAQWSSAAAVRVHHIGPDRDLSVFSGLKIELVPLTAATHIVCTGLFDDETETAKDYETVLQQIAARRLPFLCANPDIVVQRGNTLVFCAGALAQRLEEIGGQAIYPGKPYAPIYELAMKQASHILRRAISKAGVLAIGDGLNTDILGAQRFGIASLLIAEGIHAATLKRDGKIDQAAVEKACADAGVSPIGVMATLAP